MLENVKVFAQANDDDDDDAADDDARAMTIPRRFLRKQPSKRGHVGKYMHTGGFQNWHYLKLGMERIGML